MNTEAHTNTPLRPQHFFDLVDGTFRLYRAQWKRMLLVTFTMFALPYWIAEFLSLQSGGSLNYTPAQSGAELLVRLLTFLVYVIIGIIFTPLAELCIVGMGREGLKTSMPASSGPFSFIPRFGIKAIFTTLIKNLLFLCIGVFLFLVVAGPFLLLGWALNLWDVFLTIGMIIAIPTLLITMLMVYVRLLLVMPIILEEKIGYFPGIKRSWVLTKKATWKVIGALIVVWGPVMTLSFIPYILLFSFGIAQGESGGAEMMLSDGFMVAFASIQTLFGCILFPVSLCLTTLLYFDRRATREGADLTKDLSDLREVVS